MTTTLGANHTAAYWRLNDQTNQSNITLNTGTTLSAAAAGSVIAKITTAGSALTLINASQERVQETSANHNEFQAFILMKKPGATTDIEYNYTTTDTPTSGAMTFYARFIPLTSDGNLVAV